MPLDAATYLQVRRTFTPDSSDGAGSSAAKSHRQNFCAALSGGAATALSLCTGEPHAPQNRLIIRLELGLRIGEICGLQWGDFDLKLGTLKINRTVCRISCGDGHTKVVIQTPKTRTSRREIPIPKQILLMLKKLHGNASNSTSSQHPLLFNSPKPPLPRTYHIRKACTFLVQRKRRSVLGQSGSGDTGQ